ncbi:MAG: caa(3)-type oxidase subunit IV [Planctomycetes bacterium]|jgi:cytochrome c oxidase subunit 4|nr:caa(3)-type oxidase subunit IV [Planctomycetota bacterium]
MTHSEPHANEHEGHVHVVPLKVLLGVFVGLLILTWLTYAASQAARSGVLDLGAGNVIVALAIAVAKAALVALYFMHLRYDSPFNAVVLICALVFVALFIVVSMIDTVEYQPTRQDTDPALTETRPPSP